MRFPVECMLYACSDPLYKNGGRVKCEVGVEGDVVSHMLYARVWQYS